MRTELALKRAIAIALARKADRFRGWSVAKVKWGCQTNVLPFAYADQATGIEPHVRCADLA
jgi:hypothetical protein